ncbi:DNA polymerase III subunit gamma/tau [Undibacterium fentianense]|uniref:DNA polymerase III subunit gamma/tau n=1 Tax=Undibacterium fentianense TaxID=2828728 RepID=A0A941DW41_9BURK|nr:DNA polymerase III subunit gamma/tau [Undibacterium fentianense]MBR7798399.1 DNA polymerase III subunit gamma/tau [Undibacterium fentianense]
MSYQVLARKYRPKSFSTLVGQEHVVRALTHALDQQRLHHAYLFTGTRGVGKTTLSRILAKSFNCEKGITAQPCGQCEACVAIDAGRFVDYIEMDAASNRGVDEMATLLEQAIYAPSNARYKVYMIDEVHMLTNHAFNAMLKTLEEPPEHIKFILATTDPQKIPVTVLSRCLQFNLKQMPPGHIVGHLENILGQEQIEFEVSALRLLAQGAHGSMRDALSLTDQAIAYAAGKVSLDAVQNMLGALDQSYLLRLLDALLVEDGRSLLGVADEMAARSLSYKAALQDLATLLHQITVAQLVPSALPEDLPERAELLRLAQAFAKEEIQLYYQIAIHGRNEIGLAPDEYAGFCMCLMRMLAFRPASSTAQGSASRSDGDVAARHSTASQSTVRSSNGAQILKQDLSVTPRSNNANLTDQVAIEQIAKSELIEDGEKVAIPLSSALNMQAPVPNKPMSPAMAALAAARAGSANGAKKQNGIKAPMALSSESPNQSSVPSISIQDRESSAKSERVITPASSTVQEIAKSSNRDLEPPPWDDIDIDQYSLTPTHGRHKEIQESDYWSEEISNQAHRPDAAETATAELQLESENVALAATEINLQITESAPQSGRLEEWVPLTSSSQTIENASRTLKLLPVPEIEWDGHWPNLAASLPLRGVAQQLAQQSELRDCVINGNAVLFKLCVPLQTLLSAGSGEKLSAVLNEKFATFQREVRLEFEIGAVELTANAQAVAERAERQAEAENSIRTDGFVQTLMREFGATILTGSVRPV